MKRTIRSLALVLTLLSACATTSEVVPMGDGKFSVTAGSHTPGRNGLGDTRSQVLKTANAYCAGLKKALSVDNIKDDMTINTYSTSLVFHCQ